MRHSGKVALQSRSGAYQGVEEVLTNTRSRSIKGDNIRSLWSLRWADERIICFCAEGGYDGEVVDDVDNSPTQVKTSSTVLSFELGNGGACVGEGIRLLGHAVLCGEAHRCRQQFRGNEDNEIGEDELGLRSSVILWTMTRVASLPPPSIFGLPARHFEGSLVRNQIVLPVVAR